MDTITKTERTPGGRLKLALHANKTRAEKLALLRKADAIIRGGYPQSTAEKRTHININDLRAWAEQLGNPLALPGKKPPELDATTI